jgi:hypothetical protein
MASRNVPTVLQSLAQTHICNTGEFWRKYSLNSYTVLHFSEIMWFREHFEANT